MSQWSLAPNLNQARYNHSSCVLSGTLYIFGGFSDKKAENEEQKEERPNEQSKWISSIECLNAREEVKVRGPNVSWKEIELSQPVVGRANSLMAPIGPEEILIMGGNNSRYMGDAWIFNTRTSIIEPIEM